MLSENQNWRTVLKLKVIRLKTQHLLLEANVKTIKWGVQNGLITNKLKFVSNCFILLKFLFQYRSLSKAS